jgi:TolB-like protein
MSHQTAAVVRRSLPNYLIRILFALAAVAISSGVGRASSNVSAPPRKVLVLAPAVVNPDPQFAWLGLGMQRSLVADLTRHLPQDIVASDDTANDAAQASALAHKAGAQRVIGSTIQLAGDQIRFTGEVVDVGSGRALLALKVTGRLDDLFEMEDVLAAQAIRGLAPPRAVEKSVPAVTIAPSGPLRLDYASAASQAGLQYARPYEDDRFQAAHDRYFYGSSAWGCGGWFGGCCWGWGYSIYPTASPGWAW